VSFAAEAACTVDTLSNGRSVPRRKDTLATTSKFCNIIRQEAVEDAVTSAMTKYYLLAGHGKSSDGEILEIEVGSRCQLIDKTKVGSISFIVLQSDRSRSLAELEEEAKANSVQLLRRSEGSRVVVARPLSTAHLSRHLVVTHRCNITRPNGREAIMDLSSLSADEPADFEEKWSAEAESARYCTYDASCKAGPECKWGSRFVGIHLVKLPCLGLMASGYGSSSLVRLRNGGKIDLCLKLPADEFYLLMTLAKRRASAVDDGTS